MSASLVILNANIITLNPKRPRAAAVPAQNDRIVAVGSNAEIRKHLGNGTRVINAKNKTLVPGLVDCHVHMTAFGFFLQRLDIRNAKSIKEMQQKLQEYASKSLGRGWILGGARAGELNNWCKMVIIPLFENSGYFVAFMSCLACDVH